MSREAAQRLLLIAPHNSYRIAPYIIAAEELGVDVTIASAGEYSLVAAISEGLHINFSEPLAALTIIETAHRATPFSAVLGSDDYSVELASMVAEKLGLPHNPPAAVLMARRKDKARACLQAAGVNVPVHRRIDLRQSLQAQIPDIRFPCVLKPLAMSASRGVIRANNENEFRQAVARLQTILREVENDEERHVVLVEDYIDGIELAYEGLLVNGKLTQLALFDKPEPLHGPFFEESYYISPSRHGETIQKNMHTTVAAACSAYGLRQGPVHAECRVDARGKIWVLEVAARTIGGECARLVEFATGQKLEKLVIGQLLGHAFVANKITDGAGVLMIPISTAGILRRVEGVLAAQAISYIEDVVISVRDGHELVPVPDGSSYLGFIYACAPDADRVEQALRTAHDKLKIVTAPLFRIEAQVNSA